MAAPSISRRHVGPFLAVARISAVEILRQAAWRRFAVIYVALAAVSALLPTRLVSRTDFLREVATSACLAWVVFHTILFCPRLLGRVNHALNPLALGPLPIGSSSWVTGRIAGAAAPAVAITTCLAILYMLATSLDDAGHHAEVVALRPFPIFEPILASILFSWVFLAFAALLSTFLGSAVTRVVLAASFATGYFLDPLLVSLPAPVRSLLTPLLVLPSARPFLPAPGEAPDLTAAASSLPLGLAFLLATSLIAGRFHGHVGRFATSR